VSRLRCSRCSARTTMRFVTSLTMLFKIMLVGGFGVREELQITWAPSEDATAPTSAPTRAPTSAPSRAPTSAPTSAPASTPTVPTYAIGACLNGCDPCSMAGGDFSNCNTGWISQQVLDGGCTHNCIANEPTCIKDCISPSLIHQDLGWYYSYNDTRPSALSCAQQCQPLYEPYAWRCTLDDSVLVQRCSQCLYACQSMGVNDQPSCEAACLAQYNL